MFSHSNWICKANGQWNTRTAGNSGGRCDMTALHGERPANFVGSCCFAVRPANCWLFFLVACAGRRVRRLCPPAVALFCGLCACLPLPCHAHCPSHRCPVQFCFAHPPVHSMCARIVASSCKDCPVGSCNTGLQWRPVRRFICDCFLFPAESMILGHGVV